MQDFDFEIQSAQERRRMAQALRNQGFQMPEAQMVGGRYIAPGIDQVLVQALKQYGATKEEKAAENQIRALNQQRAEKMQSALDEFLIKSQGRPAEVLPPDVAGPPRPAEPQDMPGAFRALMGAPDAGYRQAGFTGAANFAQQQAEQQRKAQENQRLMSILQSSTPQQAIAAGVPVETVKSYYESRNFGRDKVARTVEIEGAGGEKLIQSYDDFGQPIGTPVPAYLAPIQLNRGNKIELVKPTAGQSFTVGMSPSEAANVSLRGQEIQLRRQEVERGAGGKAPPGYRFKPDGSLEPIPGGPFANASGQKPLTESQAKGTLFLGQMRSATEELDKLPQVSPVSTAMTGLTATNFAAGADAQKVAQLQNQWAEAYLRAKTGAAATQGEVELNRRTFFPVVGDSDSVIAQKKQMRKQAEKDMEATAGPGATTAGKTGQLSPQDQQALDWANANSNDPRAAEIKRRLGVK
jgi:hypothetical protein